MLKFKNVKNALLLSFLSIAFVACDNNDDNNREVVTNDMMLNFNNTFGDTPIILGDTNTATVNTSDAGQSHKFSELKYVISNIRLVDNNGHEYAYHVDNLDKGAFVINQANENSLKVVLQNIPTADYQAIKFGLGVPSELNTLDEVRFPNFYNTAGANDTQMMWEWGTGYRFTKIEGFYGEDDNTLSIHTGSTIEGEEPNFTQGVDAYRDITLQLSTNAEVDENAPTIVIKADFDNLLSGAAHTITLEEGLNATNNIHSAMEMVKFVDNLGGNTTNSTGMFSIEEVRN